MEIERINENTVKFYISYVDIEDRGFEKEDIWYNRERSEQLFWQMMDEVNHKEDFAVEGPLWIQVQALDKGLEILVTKAHLSKGGSSIDTFDEIDETIDIEIQEKARQVFGMDEATGGRDARVSSDDSGLWMTAHFRSLEDVIQLSHSFNHAYESELITALYHYNDKYYLYIEIQPELHDYQEDILSQVLEYCTESDITYHVLEEYGKVIFSNDVFDQMKQYFHVTL